MLTNTVTVTFLLWKFCWNMYVRLIRTFSSLKTTYKMMHNRTSFRREYRRINCLKRGRVIFIRSSILFNQSEFTLICNSLLNADVQDNIDMAPTATTTYNTIVHQWKMWIQMLWWIRQLCRNNLQWHFIYLNRWYCFVL